MRDNPEPSLSRLSPKGIRGLAAQYAAMAVATQVVGIQEPLVRLVKQLENLAALREGIDPNQCETMSAMTQRRHARL